MVLGRDLVVISLILLLLILGLDLFLSLLTSVNTAEEAKRVEKRQNMIKAKWHRQ